MLSIEKCDIEAFFLERVAIPKDSVFQIASMSSNQFRCVGLVNTAWLNINYLSSLVDYARFKEIEGKPQIVEDFYKFEEVTKQKSSISLQNSDLGKTSFIDCNLQEFDEFFFFNTKLLEVFVAGTQLPTQLTFDYLNPPYFPSQGTQNEQERLAFGQFKKISDNRGDNVAATEFLAKEMEAYAKQIKH